MVKNNGYRESFVQFAQPFEVFMVELTFRAFNKIISCIIIIFIPGVVFSQETKVSEAIISIVENLSSDNSDPETTAIYFDKLQELAENPVRLNSSGEDEISRLFFLSDFQIKALVDYSHSSGKIISVYELANIPGFDKITVEMMIPFITLEMNNKPDTDTTRWRNTLLTNLSYKTGNNDTSFLGSSVRLLSKYKFISGGFTGGFTIEKDQGEKLLTGNPPVPDFLSAYLSYSGKGVIKRIILGDFSARIGQGTNINTGIRTGLSLIAPGYMAARDELKQYTSTDENNFFRGVAAEFAIKNLEVSLFYSKKSIDASTGSGTDFSNEYIESFYQGGLHNTYSMMKKKDAVTDLTYGLNVSYNFNNVKVGIALSDDRISLPLRVSENNPENILDFNGDRNTLYSVYYNSLIKRILLFGEISSNMIHKYALVQGLSLRPSDRLTVNFLFRNYSTGYFTLHGKGPGSSSSTENEQGILGNFSFEAAKHLFISGGCDIYRFPWLKYRNSAPSSGVKKELRVTYMPSENVAVEASYNFRLSMVDEQGYTGIADQEENIARTIKGSVKYSLSKNLTLGTRLDYKIADPSDSRGMLLLQDINYHFRQIPVAIWLRYCLFNTEDWNSRLYTYENDLLYSFSIPALSGEGSRSYIMAKWEIGNTAEIRLKYGITTLTANKTNPETTNEIKFQIKAMF
jgi:hypothetical protein